MNSIFAKLNESKYPKSPHLDYWVEEGWLSDLLQQWYPEHQIDSMIPTTLNWMEREMEQVIVWNRFLDRRSQSLTVPIFCCPDELDFGGALLIVEVENRPDVVVWNRFGFDMTSHEQLPARVGNVIQWLRIDRPFIFDRGQYENLTAEFEAWSRTQTD